MDETPDTVEVAQAIVQGEAFTDADAVAVAEAYILLVQELEAA